MSTDEKIPTAAELAEKRAAEAPVEVPAEPEAASIDPAELEKLRAAAQERDAFKDKWLRQVAEFENYQKRTRREQERYREEALRDVLSELLLVLDNLDFALKAAPAGDPMAKGVSVVRDQLLKLLAGRGAVPIDTPAGTPFDPNLHEAVSALEVQGLSKDEVLEVLRRGFRLGPALLRPAQVVVKKAAPAPSASASPPP